MSISLNTPFWGTASRPHTGRAAGTAAEKASSRRRRSVTPLGIQAAAADRGVQAERAGLRFHGFRSIRERSEIADSVPAAVVERRGVAAQRRGGLRLTRRGRFVLFGLPVLAGAVTVAALLMLILVPGQAQADTDHAAPDRSVVTVSSGDTLWSIAREVDPEGDPRVTTAQIADLNDLTQSALSPGQQLVVPTPRGE